MGWWRGEEGGRLEESISLTRALFLEMTFFDSGEPCGRSKRITMRQLRNVLIFLLWCGGDGGGHGGVF